MTDWSQVVERYGPVVWRTACRLLGNEADAADCFQETFISALAVSRREKIANYSALLRRIATARALDRLRQRRRHVDRHDEIGDWNSVEGAEHGPREQSQARELAESLRRALVELPDDQAEVFCLRCLEGLTFEEIAQRLEMQVGTARVVLHRARSRLRTLLAPYTEPADG